MTVVVAERVDTNPNGSSDYFIQLRCDRCDAWVWATELMAEAWAMGILVVCKPCLVPAHTELRRARLAEYN